MRQTLLALVVLAAAMLFSYNQMRASARSQSQAYRAEMEQMALGVGMQTMEVVRARAFDAATLGVPEETIVPTSEFTPESGFGIAGDCQLYSGGSGTDCSTVEEFHETSGEVPFPLASDLFWFDVEIEVHYVCANMERASTSGACTAPTARKEVMVTVQDDPSGGGSPRLREPITYTEVFSYP
jgi:hypothetical protein